MNLPGLSALASIPPLELALRLLLLDFLLRPVGDPVLRPFTLVLAAAGMVVPGLVRRSWLWLALAALTALRVILDWPFPDNHAYLLAYWCLAAAIATSSESPEEVLASNGRLLVGLAFAFASLWKLVLSPDFVDGTFFRVVLLLDLRFEWLASLVGGLSLDELRALRAPLLQHLDVAAAGSVGGVALPPRLEAFALGATWLVALLEPAVALAFLARGKALRAWRDPLLLVFCAGTFAVVPVPGFGWLLLSMGVAQCAAEPRALRLCYPVVFALLILYAGLPGRGAFRSEPPGYDAPALPALAERP